MGKKRYVGTNIKGAEPRVRFNVQRHDDGRVVKERAMSGMVVDQDGNEVPIVVNRVVFQCEHGDEAAHWQGIAALGFPDEGSIEIRCDLCGFSDRIRRGDLHGLLILATSHDFVVEHGGLIGIGFHDSRPGAGYATVQLKAAAQFAKIWRERLAEDRADDDQQESL